MSVSYSFYIEIECDAKEIRTAQSVLPEFRNLSWYDGVLSGSEDYSIWSSNSEGKEAQRIADAVSKGLGRRVPVKVSATCLEDLPYNTYEHNGWKD